MLSPAWARETVTKTVHWYLLVEAEKTAAGRSPEQQAAITGYFDAATRRYLAAEALSEPADAVGAIVLYRESITLFVVALAKTTDDGAAASLGVAQALDFVDGLVADAPTARREGILSLRSAFRSDDALALDALGPEDLQKLRTAAQETAAWLRSRIDPRPARALRMARQVRLAVAALSILALLCVATAYALAPKNIARGKITVASSHHPGTPPASGATNGEIEPSYGVHTEADAEPWVMVDLGKPYSVREVRVYNRGDGWQDEGLPIALDVSLDGKAWKEVDRRATPYSQSQPWIAKIHVPPVRYVRVRRPVRGVIAISEIEVYS
jgi:hypothetical protein